MISEKGLALNNKKITILLLSDGCGQARNLKIPSLFIFPAIAFLIAAFMSLYGILSDYFEIRRQAPRIAAIMEQNARHEEQQAYLSARLEKVSQKLEGLREQEQKLRTLANLSSEDDTLKVMGVGGGSEPETGSDVAKEESSKSLVLGIRERGAHRQANGLDAGPLMSKMEDHPEGKQNDAYPLLPFRPFTMPSRGWIYAGFGSRFSPGTGEQKFHKGIEIAAKMKAPVRAPADGVVLYVGEDHRYGKILAIEHGYAIITRYGNLNEIMVREGEIVPKGKTIASIGARKTAIGPTLHYEVVLGGIPINPLHFPLG